MVKFNGGDLVQIIETGVIYEVSYQDYLTKEVAVKGENGQDYWFFEEEVQLIDRKSTRLNSSH